MALAQKKVFLNVVLADGAGNKATVPLSFDYADFAALATAVAGGAHTTAITHLEAVTRARVVAYSIGVQFAENANYFAEAGVQIEDIASISCLIDGEPLKRATLRIPAPESGIFVGSTGENANIVDTTDSDLLAWLEHFSSDGECLVSDGEQIADPAVAGNFKGKRIHRGSTKG